MKVVYFFPLGTPQQSEIIRFWFKLYVARIHFRFSLDYKSQYTLRSLEEKKERQGIHDSNVTKAAMLKLLKVTVFLVKNHWAHTSNYESTVRFIGEDLQ